MIKRELGSNMVLYVFFILIAIGILFKLLAPYSGFGSRIGVRNPIKVTLPEYADKTKPITMGRTEQIKWVCFYDKDGNIRLKEISDFGILEAEYILILKDEK